MRKHLYVILLFINSFVCFSQSELSASSNAYKIKTARINFISNQINLTPEQAEKFWPIYNAHYDFIYNLKKERLELRRHSIVVNLNEEESKELYHKTNLFSQKTFRSKKRMYVELEKFLTYKQLLLLGGCESRFRSMLLEQLKHTNKTIKK
ncbi:hypothetical protein N9901_02670 [Flavobacteriaceae bacterium]|nr:hypothetical protein [Flavobacteriaceae bacterium]